VVLKPGWLNRQFDQVSKNVNEWPEWMKRAAGVAEERTDPRPEQSEPAQAGSRREVQSSTQQRLL
jgi:hypothetical protein